MIEWDSPSERYYQYGVDRGVLYIGEEDPIPWNGLLGIDEDHDAVTKVYYVDGQVYYATVEPGEFKGTLSALFWPDAFSTCLGIPEVAPGMYVDNQRPRPFGLSYRSLIGSGGEDDLFGYQIHLVYNALVKINTRNRTTLSNSFEPAKFVFELIAKPIKLPNRRPSAHYILDTRGMSPAKCTEVENLLYGVGSTPGRLPLPTELYDLLQP